MSTRQKRTISIMLALIFLFCAYPTLATTFYVSSGGSIQAAIDGASNGDEIEVAPGTYNEGINFLTRAIRVYSSDGPGVTTINGTGYYHVVQCVLGEGPDTILEGFTISGGNATGAGANSEGGGLRIANSNPTILDCIFTGNAAVDGGGMYIVTGSPTVIDCIFTGNSAVNGGAIYNSSADPFVTHCEFDVNTATGSGPGTGGGGIYNLSANPTVTNCTFSRNTTQGYGGGMFNNSSSPTVDNCLFTGNTAQSSGGGLANYAGSVGAITNCTLWGNTTEAGGGGIRNYSSAPAVTNCIIWGNTPDQVSLEGSSTEFTYCDIESGTGYTWFGVGCVDADPLFLDAAGGDFSFISSGSPCVDTGYNSVVTEPNDLAGNPRIFDGDWDGTATVDMGVYELQFGQIHNITQDIWYGVIQIAIDEAVPADQIEVGPGTCNEAINFKGKAIGLYSTDGPEVTTIDATGLNASVVTCKIGEGPDTILQGFTLTGGIGTVKGSYRYGGGMYNVESTPTVSNCIFSLNSVTGDGGGMYNHPAAPTVTNCTFTENHANFAGGGMDNRSGSNPTVTDCNFIDNTAYTYGAGMENWDKSNPTVTNCDFIYNISYQYGGGMSNTGGSSPTVTDCDFTRNRTDVNHYDGGAVYNNTGTPTFTRCNFEENTSYRHGGGMYNIISSPEVTDCVFYYNFAQDDGGGFVHVDKLT